MYRDSHIMCLQALAWWVTELSLQGKDIDIIKFDDDTMIDGPGRRKHGHRILINPVSLLTLNG